MNIIRCLIVLAAACTLSASASEIENLVPEKVIASVKINSLKGLIEVGPDHPFTMLKEDKKVMEFWDSLLNEADFEEFAGKIEEKTGKSVDELIELFNGQLLAVIPAPKLKSKFNKKKPMKPYVKELSPIIILGHNGKVDEVEKLIKHIFDVKMKADPDTPYNILEDTIHGAKVYNLEPTDEKKQAGYMAVSDKYLFVSLSEDMLEQSLERASLNTEEMKSGLAANDDYQKVIDKVGSHEMLFYINFEFVMQFLEQMIRTNLNPSPDTPPNPMMPNPDVAVNTLALSSIESLYFSYGKEQDEYISKSGIYSNGFKGLLSLLTYSNQPIRKPDFIPEDVQSFSVTNVDISGFFKNLETMFLEMAPMIGGIYNNQAGMIQAQTGVDVREVLKNAIGDLIVTYTLPEKENVATPGSVFAFSLKNAQQFETALDAVFGAYRMNAAYEMEEYLGNKIRIQKNAPLPGQPMFSFTIAKDIFLLGIGERDILKGTLSQWNRPEKSVWTSENVRKIMPRFAPENAAISYQKLDSMLNTIFNLIAQQKQQIRNMEMQQIEEEGVAADPENLPEPVEAPKLKMPWVVISESFVESDGIHSKSVLLKVD